MNKIGTSSKVRTQYSVALKPSNVDVFVSDSRYFVILISVSCLYGNNGHAITYRYVADYLPCYIKLVLIVTNTI